MDVGKAAAFDSRCTDAWKGVRYYRKRYDEARRKLGQSLAPPVEEGASCKRLRERADYWKFAVRVNEEAYRKHWAPPPEPYLSIARCEQRSHTGLYGVDWQAYSFSYEGAYGFLHETWDRFKPRGYPASAHVATIYQQTEVAKILVRTFNGYSSWPACHRRLGLPG